MENTFQVGDVVYKAKGLFRIAEIGVPDFMWEKRMTYFTLKELKSKSSRETI